MERPWRMDSKSLFETKACIPPLGGPQMTCQILTTPVWHIPTQTEQSTVFMALSSVPGTESGLNRSCAVCCPCVTERTQAIKPGQPLPAKEPKTATTQNTGQLPGSWAYKAST